MVPEKCPRAARPVAAIRLDGGRLCLDFVNTIHDRYAVDAEDYICQPERFIEWCVRPVLSALASTSPRRKAQASVPR